MCVCPAGSAKLWKGTLHTTEAIYPSRFQRVLMRDASRALALDGNGNFGSTR
jgi:hypothetical protein